MFVKLLHSHPCAVSEPDNYCRINILALLLRSPEVTWVNFHLTHLLLKSLAFSFISYYWVPEESSTVSLTAHWQPLYQFWWMSHYRKAWLEAPYDARNSRPDHKQHQEATMSSKIQTDLSNLVLQHTSGHECHWPCEFNLSVWICGYAMNI